MGRRQQKELERLEKALMEAELPQEPYDFEEVWQHTPDNGYDIYNTDEADVDLEDYSEEIYQDRGSRGLGVAAIMLLMIVLSLAILVLLKLTGVL